MFWQGEVKLNKTAETLESWLRVSVSLFLQRFRGNDGERAALVAAKKRKRKADTLSAPALTDGGGGVS